MERVEKTIDVGAPLRIVYHHEPDGALETAGEAMGVLSGRVEKTLKQFKDFIEKRGHQSGMRRPAFLLDGSPWRVAAGHE